MATEGMNRAATLFRHVQAIERLESDKADVQADINERIKLAVEDDGFDKTALKEIIKRRKKGKAQCATVDAMIADYEDMLEAHIDSVREKSTRDNTPDEPAPEPETIDGGQIGHTEQAALPDYSEGSEPVDAEFAEVDDDPDGSFDAETDVDDPDDGMTEEPADDDLDAPW